MRAFMTMAGLLFAAQASAQSGDVPVKISTYAITGTTGLELYQSIAANAPNGGGHIAQTTPKLTWNRLFDERGGDCYLVRARPRLSITQTYPKPKGRLSQDMQRRWDKFMTVLRRHEDAHVSMIKDMVASTEAGLAGMVERDDRSCAKVKKSVSARIDEFYQAHRARSREFDKAEYGQGGPMFRAMEDFVNER